MIEVPPAPTRPALLLGSGAARSCPVKTSNTYDRTVPVPATGPAGEPPARVLAARTFEAQTLEALVQAAAGLVVDLRLLAEDPAASTEACVAAMRAGAAVVVGGTLPVDRDGHRSGRPDLLVRGADTADGRPTYHPAEVKAHKVLLPTRRAVRDDDVHPPALATSTFTAPRPLAPRPLEGMTLRLGSREGDFLQLAHYLRMLEAAGFAPAEPLGGVVGTDTVEGTDPLLVWADLSEPVVRTYSRSDPAGWRLRSLLERYDHEHGLRVDVARTAARRRGEPEDPAPLVQPVVVRECGHCVWWEHCRSLLPEDDVSLRIDKGALDVREVLALRRHGVGTVARLAGADLDALLPRYLPEVTHRAGAETRLRVARRRARMLTAGVSFDRETTGPIAVPAAAVEVDLDIESAADGRIYLWGFLLDDTTRPGGRRYVSFSRFDDLDDAAEAALAVEAFRWLQTLVETSESVRVYHYSAYEPSAIRALAQRTGEPGLRWAAAYADELVDLYDVVKTHFFGAGGLGLKPIAQHAGFRWRDDDPGGLNSQSWFADAVHHPDPEVRDRARTRVLEYNEDDVLATAELRAWLRSR